MDEGTRSSATHGSAPPVRGLRHAIARTSLLEPVYVGMVAPLLLFPTVRPSWTGIALVGLLCLWLLLWWATGRPGMPTPVDAALLLLVVMIAVAALVSTLPHLTLPKLTGLVLGLAVFRAANNQVRHPRHLSWAAVICLVLGLGLAAAGALGTNWANKMPALGTIVPSLPRLLASLPGAEGGVNPNELGGTLTLSVPVVLGACLVPADKRRGRAWLARLLAALCAIFLIALLLFTQSRSAWLGVLAGVVVMALIRWSWARWLVPIALLLASAMVLLSPSGLTLSTILESSALAGAPVSSVEFQGRVELWNRALYAIQDFPLTGLGLGTFREHVHLLYPLFFVDPGTDLGHAHNVFLQVAVDVGLPGLVAYVALVGTALWAAWQVARVPRAAHSWLALGLVGSLVAFHAYGLTDALALGAKPGVALWLVLGLAMAVWRMTPHTHSTTRAEGSEPEQGGA